MGHPTDTRSKATSALQVQNYDIPGLPSWCTAGLPSCATCVNGTLARLGMFDCLVGRTMETASYRHDPLAIVAQITICVSKKGRWRE